MIRKKIKVFTSGQMGVNIIVSIRMIRGMVRGRIPGRADLNT